MKSPISLVVLCALSIVLSDAKAQENFKRYVPFSLYFGSSNPNEISPYVNAEYEVILTYKDAQNNDLYSEIQAGVLDSFAFAFLNIGEGEPDPLNPYSLFGLDFESVTKVCYVATLTPKSGNEVTVTGEKPIGATPRSIVSEVAINARGLADRMWMEQPIRPADMLCAPDDVTISFVTDYVSGPSTSRTLAMKRSMLRDYIRVQSAPSAVTGQLQKYFRAGTGLQLPVSFGDTSLTSVENYVTLNVNSLAGYYNAFGVKVTYDPTDSIGHSTSAIYAENLVDVQSVGLFAKGVAWGSYNQGRSGMIGITAGSSNGAGIWGYIGNAPLSGGYKYAVLGDAQNRPDSYAGMFFGDVAHTGDIMQVSDRRLKTEIQSPPGRLDQVLQLQPAQYRFTEDMPYSLPGGIHYGFIAQEVEQVFPDLVHNITLPIDPGIENKSSEGTATYKAVNYTELIPILTAALQELNAKVNALEEKVVAQAAEIESLKNDRH